MIKRFILLFGALLLASIAFVPNAKAVSGNIFCMTPVQSKCIDAWGGGPFVKIYTGQNGGSNQDFDVFFAPGGHLAFRFSGTGTWADGQHCIGDAYNDPNNASSSLDVCNVSSNTFGWGTLFDAGYSGCLPGYQWYRNVHWGGYLGAQDPNTNGSPFYLNKGSPTCFLDTAPQ